MHLFNLTTGDSHPVTSTADTAGAAGCEAGGTETCTLRGAIEAANASGAADTIDFAAGAEGVIEIVGAPLPEISGPLVIDGTSAPSYTAPFEQPVVEIDGSAAASAGAVYGLAVFGGEVTIKGLVIGGFETAAVHLGGDGHSRLCSSWLGVERDATTLADGAGVEVAEGSLENQIGVGCGAGEQPNVIAGNEGWGIEDAGRQTQIGDNVIGISPTGVADGNGLGGIREFEEAEGPQIGGAAAGAPGPNVIAHNGGPGVLVEAGASQARIRSNTIYANTGAPIEIQSEAPVPPTVEAVVAESGGTTIEGEATAGAGGESIGLDFFAAESCTASGGGEAREFLGSDAVVAASAGATAYDVTVGGALPAGEHYVSVTSTGSSIGKTSELSQCFHYVAPPTERTFTVNSLGDGETAAGCEAETTCTLRGAIEAANETEALDTIEFEIAGLLEPLTELPHLTEPVDIDATTAPGYAGSPVFEIGGSEQLNDGVGTEGLVVDVGGEGSTIKGLAVTRFDNGIVVEGNRASLEDDKVFDNGDIGVAVNGAEPKTAVRRTEIYANGTGELEFQTPSPVPAPVLESFVAGATNTTYNVPFEGGQANRSYAIDVFANAHCEKPGEHGPLEVFLASGEVTTNSAGEGEAEIHGGGLSGIDAEVFTVTATDLTTGTTSEIGHCAYSPIETELESTPPPVTSSSSATFTFSGKTVGHTKGFECSLDGSTFEACNSPEELSGLPEGTHHFEVRAYNGEGTRDFSPASYEWTVETEPPVVTIDSGPSGTTKATAATFTFSATDPGSPVTTVECKLDTGPFEACTSPTTQEYSALPDGSHTFQVRATDEAGNTSAPVSRTWTVDTEPPAVTIESGPSGTTKATDATFTFSATDPGSPVTAVECKLDTGPFEACTSPKEYTALPDGSHTFQVRATDEAGNTSAPVSRTWTVDTEPPVVTIESGPSGTTKATTATFTFSATDPGSPVTTVECKLDTGAFEACTSPTTQEYTALPDGSHTFQVRATDEAGNTSDPASRTWTVSTEGPEITFTSAPPAKTNSTTAAFAFEFSDSTGDIVAEECSLDGPPFEACESPQEFTGLAPGSHTFEVFAKDEAGTTNTVAYKWKVVTEAPSPAITAAPPASTETTTATFAFGGVPGSEISSYECSLDGGAFAACTSPQNFSGLAPGVHSFSVRAKDEAGNTSAPTTYTWTVAATPPPTVEPSGPEPSNGEKVVVEPTEGKVKIKLPGTNKYVTLTELKEIPVGAVIDATNGRVTLTSIGPGGIEQTAEFFGGVFKVKQKEGSGLVVLELVDSNVCTASKGKAGGGASRAFASSVAARPSGHTSGKLWGSGHGSFRTEGHDGSATVEGTIWLVEDRCNGTTFFKTRRGIVKVRDFVSHKTLALPAGKTYVAGEE